MTSEQLASELKRRYDSAPDGGKATAIHLFGIQFADELQGHRIKEIAEAGTGHASNKTDIRNGMRLSKHVMLKAQIG